MTFLEVINAAQAIAASNQGYVQLPKDQLFSAAFVYVIHTNIVPTAQNKLFEKFDSDIDLTARKLKGTVHTAAAIFKIMSGSSEATSSEARRTGAALKRLGYKSVRHSGKILWIL